MEQSIFEHSSYKAFLKEKVGNPKRRTGLKSAIARALKCQPTYISQVLNGEAQLSLEQAYSLGEFLGLTDDERSHLLLLVQKDRAGIRALKDYFQKQIDEALSRRVVLTERLGKGTQLAREDQATYYSSWQYAAVHIALTIPELKTRDAVAKYLNISPKRVGEILEFLVSTGIVEATGGEYLVRVAQVRLGRDSPHIISHHSNLRLQAIQSLEREKATELHYSGIASVSKADMGRLKDRLLETIKAMAKDIGNSSEEELVCLGVDFFSLNQRD